MTLNIIEQDGDTLMNICIQMLKGEKNWDEVKNDVQIITDRMSKNIAEKSERLKKLMMDLP